MAGVRECVYAAVLGKDLAQHVRSSKVLVVGAGGIGCELLKNLVLAGFKDIEVVSLSGLNVFVKLPKARFPLSNILKEDWFRNILARNRIPAFLSNLPTCIIAIKQPSWLLGNSLKAK